MAGLFALVAGLITLWGALRQPRGGAEIFARLASLAPLLLVLGALLSAQNPTFYHFSLRGLRFDLEGEARTLAHLGGAVEEPKAEAAVARPAPAAKEEAPYLSFGE